MMNFRMKRMSVLFLFSLFLLPSLSAFAAKDFAALDANYKSRSAGTDGFVWSNAFEEPFALEGAPWTNEDGLHVRLADRFASKCVRGKGVKVMATQGAGVAVRFRTNAPRIGIKVHFRDFYSGTCRTQSAGFDLYQGRHFLQTLTPNAQQETDFTGSFYTEASGATKDFTLYFPLHCTVETLEIGLPQGATREPPTPHMRKGRVAFVGSSITNGGAAMRPGLTYVAIVGRLLDVEVVNLGFSGNCKGDEELADGVVNLKPVAVVSEYDHNADLKLLRETHRPFIGRIRAGLPDTPIILFCSPVKPFGWEYDARREVVASTWLSMRAAGDKKVDFLDPKGWFEGEDAADFTNDRWHPNDAGARIEAQAIANRLRTVLEKVD